MPVYNNIGTARSDVGKVHVFTGTTTEQIGKVYANNGTTNYLIYTAETNLGSIGPMGQYWLLNVGAYNKMTSKTSEESINISGCSTLVIDYSMTIKNGYSHANGNKTTAELYAKFEDDSTVLLGSFTKTLHTAGDTAETAGTATISCEGKTTLYLYATLSKPSAGGDSSHMYLNPAFTQILGS